MIYIVIIISLVGPLLGALIGVGRKYSKEQIYMMLAFAAGVMIFISAMQLLPSAFVLGGWPGIFSGLVLGFTVSWLLNFVIPHYHHADHESKLSRAAFFLFLGIFIHNFPEGMAIGASGVQSINFSFLVALAIAIHDIPETICISAPLAKTLDNRHKAFWMAIFSAVPTIAGFLFSYYFLQSVPDVAFSIIISTTAGIMLYISFFEILRPIYAGRLSKGIINLFVLIGALFVLLLQKVLG
jgi:ZIP family zinc transporter